MYEIGQKVHFGFSVTFYGKTQTKLFGQPNAFTSPLLRAPSG